MAKTVQLVPESNTFLNCSSEELSSVEEIFTIKKWDQYDDNGKEYTGRFQRVLKILEIFDDNEKKVFIDLLKDFLLVDYRVQQKFIQGLMKKLKEQITATCECIYLIPFLEETSSGLKPSRGAFSFANNLKFLIEDSGYFNANITLCTRIESIPKNIKSNDILLYVDDFLGTGGTAVMAVELLKNIVTKIHGNLLLCCLVVMKDGICFLDRKLDENIIYAKLLKKGISENPSIKNKKLYIEVMKLIEGKIPVREEFKFGYGKSEALVSFTRTPNNTFPLFWLKPSPQGDYMGKYEPLFSR